MFQALGNLVSRIWPVVIVVWILLLAVATWLAPAWNDIVVDREFAYLPEDSPSRRGQAMFAKAFPDLMHPCSAFLVIRRDAGQAVLQDADMNFIRESLVPGLRDIAATEAGVSPQASASKENTPLPFTPGKSIIGAIYSFADPGIGALLVSPSKKTALVDIELKTELLEQRNWITLGRIDTLLAQLRREGKTPVGLQILQTGSAVVGRDVTRGQARSAGDTEFWTFAMVIILLLLIYRAPLLALVPLITVFCAVDLAIKMLLLLAQAGCITLFEGIQVFITVIMYGTGVDYSLFLIARYKEELDRGLVSERNAIADAVGHVGAALLASSATVTFAIAMMIFARFGQFHFAGIGIAASLVIGLCAVLTLAPALLRLFRRWAFWPYHEPGEHAETASEHNLDLWWHRLARVLERRPGVIWVVTVILMVPLAVHAVREWNNLEFDLSKRLPATAPSVIGAAALEDEFPAGVIDPIVAVIRKPGLDFRQDKGQEALAELTRRMAQQRQELDLADIRSLTRPLGMTPAALDALDDLAEQAQLSKDKNDAANLQRQVLRAYVSQGDITHMEFLLNHNPMSHNSLGRLERLQEMLKKSLPTELQGAQLEFFGLTASIRDLRDVTNADQTRIETLVVICVTFVLLVLRRRVLVSLYLVVSVLLSFFTALGATFFVFWALDPGGFTGLDWKVPIFLFTILVAVGEDYNIFLMSRVDEEQRHFGPTRGVTHALIKTGRIITSCGIIMAGTFSSLLSASLMDLKQLGFALTCGVLLDTFVVRPILVPTFLLLLNGGRFRLGRKTNVPQAKPVELALTGRPIFREEL